LHARLLHLQRTAGNAAVTRLIQRQGEGPTDAGAPGGAPLPATPSQPADAPGQAQAPAATPAEQAPVELPPQGSLRITFSETPRQWKLDTSEIDKLKIGVGKLSTPPIPAGEWLTVTAEVGAQTPPRVTASLTLSPLAGEITAAEIEKHRPSHRAAGTVGAAIGGIQGGLIGGAVGGLALGLPGAVYGAVKGAGMGGVMGGRAAESLAGMFDGRHELTATVLSGSVSGVLGLHYEPYLKLTLSAAGFSWLAGLEAQLRTRMNLTLRPGASLVGSQPIKLVFDGGRLVRTEFSLTPELTMGVNFEAAAHLIVALRLLPFMDGSRFPEAGGSGAPDQQRESSLYQSDQFGLFSYASQRSTRGALRLAKGSPLELLESLLGVDDALSMANLLPAAISGGHGQPLPNAPNAPRPGAPGTDPIESDFGLSPGDLLLVRSTARLGGRQGWFRGEFLGFERLGGGGGGQPSGTGGRLYIVYRVQFPDQPVTIKTEGAFALNDLRRGDAAERLRYFRDQVLLETLQPFLDDPLLDVGPNAGASIPATGPVPSRIERQRIQPIGNSSGCHIAAGHSTGGRAWVADHQRPTALVDHGALTSPGPQRLYPMCPSDSTRQGTLVRNILRMWLGRVP
jgi:hypothetical protein